MIPIIHINKQELLPRHVCLIRKLLLNEILSASNTIWEFNEDPKTPAGNLGVFPYNRLHAFNTLQMIDGIVPITPTSEGPYGTYITINGMGLHPWYSDSISFALRSEPLSLTLDLQEEADRQFMVNAVFLKT